ncbi:glycosyltransferase [Microbacterium esteraromaticum]|uniref:glycosyltransferase n=1 Tax=Microbacterium esteraromaticum TaxID=57043 RepID=UPI0019D3D839|nr:glycosyltransferase [Microbacterium esteraromaticum]MBN7793385.1 glycosyltransferase [Microbacterium esteraromaticum]
MTIDYQLRYHDGLYQDLADNGWQVHLVSNGGPIGTALNDHPGIHMHTVSMRRDPSPLADLASLRLWVKTLRAVRPSIVVVGTPKAGLLGGLSALLVGVQARVYELHGLRLESASGPGRVLLRSIEQLSCAVASAVVAVGASLRQRAIAERLTRLNKIRVLGAGSPSGVNIQRFTRARRDEDGKAELRKQLGIPADEPIVTFVGRINPDKGIATLTEAMAKVQALSGAHLLVVGPTDGTAGYSSVELMKVLLPRVITVGDVGNVAPYIAVSDVLCLPSRREGLPTVVLEAFAARVPVVATRATGIVDLIDHRRTGLLVNIDAVDELASAILTLLKDKALADALASRAFTRVETQYADDVVRQRWVHYLTGLLREE